MNGDEIAKEFIDHFKLLLGSKVDWSSLNLSVINDGNKVDFVLWDNLVSDVAMEEIQDALFDIDNEKAPGSDGFGSLFFKSSWHIVMTYLMQYMNFFVA